MRFIAFWAVNDSGFPAIAGDMAKPMSNGEVRATGTEFSAQIGRVANAVCHVESMKHGRTKDKYGYAHANTHLRMTPRKAQKLRLTTRGTLPILAAACDRAPPTRGKGTFPPAFD